MAQNKTGLAFHGVDTDIFQDIKIKKLKKNFKGNGFGVYFYIINFMIYRDKGCFVAWDLDVVFDVADYWDIEESLVNKIVEYCCEVGLFNKEILAKEGVLTSMSIQRRYVDMCKRAKRSRVDIPEKYRLIPEESPKLPEKSTKQTEETHIVEYSKVEYSIETVIKNNTLSSERKNFEILKKDKEIYGMFMSWIDKHAPRVNEMSEPFTQEQAIQLMTDFRGKFIEQLLIEMHDYIPLLKYGSPDMTFRKWAKRRSVAPDPQTTDIKIALWHYCITEIQKQVTVEVFNELFRDIVPIEFDGVILRLKIGAKEHVLRIESDYIPIFRPILQRAFGMNFKLHYALPNSQIQHCQKP